MCQNHFDQDLFLVKRTDSCCTVVSDTAKDQRFKARREVGRRFFSVSQVLTFARRCFCALDPCMSSATLAVYYHLVSFLAERAGGVAATRLWPSGRMEVINFVRHCPLILTERDVSRTYRRISGLECDRSTPCTWLHLLVGEDLTCSFSKIRASCLVSWSSRPMKVQWV